MAPDLNIDGELLGILGGMGPLATTYFMETIIKLTPAEHDQHHLPMVVINDPTIPDRTAAILHDGESPVPQLQTNAKTLEQAGADLMVVPCNSAHYFLDDIRDAVEIPVLNMIDATAQTLVREGIETIGLLATTGTVESGIYHEPLSTHGIVAVTPSDDEAIMDAIYAIKRGELEESAVTGDRLVTELLTQGADVVVVGCTELSIVMAESETIIDPLRLLAEQGIMAIR